MLAKAREGNNKATLSSTAENEVARRQEIDLELDLVQLRKQVPDMTEYSALMHSAVRRVLSPRQFLDEHRLHWQQFLVRLGAISSDEDQIDFESVATNFVKLDESDTIAIEPIQAERLKRFVPMELKDQNGNLKILRPGEVRTAFYHRYAEYLQAMKKSPPENLLAADEVKRELQAEFVIYMQWAVKRKIGPVSIEKIPLGKFCCSDDPE